MEFNQKNRLLNLNFSKKSIINYNILNSFPISFSSFWLFLIVSLSEKAIKIFMPLKWYQLNDFLFMYKLIFMYFFNLVNFFNSVFVKKLFVYKNLYTFFFVIFKSYHFNTINIIIKPSLNLYISYFWFKNIKLTLLNKNKPNFFLLTSNFKEFYLRKEKVFYSFIVQSLFYLKFNSWKFLFNRKEKTNKLRIFNKQFYKNNILNKRFSFLLRNNLKNNNKYLLNLSIYKNNFFIPNFKRVTWQLSQIKLTFEHILSSFYLFMLQNYLQLKIFKLAVMPVWFYYALILLKKYKQSILKLTNNIKILNNWKLRFNFLITQKSIKLNSTFTNFRVFVIFLLRFGEHIFLEKLSFLGFQNLDFFFKLDSWIVSFNYFKKVRSLIIKIVYFLFLQRFTIFLNNNLFCSNLYILNSKFFFNFNLSFFKSHFFLYYSAAWKTTDFFYLFFLKRYSVGRFIYNAYIRKSFNLWKNSKLYLNKYNVTKFSVLRKFKLQSFWLNFFNFKKLSSIVYLFKLTSLLKKQKSFKKFNYGSVFSAGNFKTTKFLNYFLFVKQNKNFNAWKKTNIVYKKQQIQLNFLTKYKFYFFKNNWQMYNFIVYPKKLKNKNKPYFFGAIKNFYRKKRMFIFKKMNQYINFQFNRNIYFIKNQIKVFLFFKDCFQKGFLFNLWHYLHYALVLRYILKINLLKFKPYLKKQFKFLKFSKYLWPKTFKKFNLKKKNYSSFNFLNLIKPYKFFIKTISFFNVLILNFLSFWKLLYQIYYNQVNFSGLNTNLTLFLALTQNLVFFFNAFLNFFVLFSWMHIGFFAFFKVLKNWKIKSNFKKFQITQNFLNLNLLSRFNLFLNFIFLFNFLFSGLFIKCFTVHLLNLNKYISLYFKKFNLYFLKVISNFSSVLSFYDRFKKVKGLTKVLSPSFSILSFFKFFYSHYYLFLNLKLYFYSKYLPVSSLFNTLKSKNHLSADISKFYLSLNEKYPLFFKFFLKPQFFKFFFSVVPVKQTKVLKNRIKIYLYYIFKSVILQSNVLNIKNVYLFWQLKLKYLTSFDLFKLFYSNLNLINLNTNFLNFKHIICQFSWFYEFFMILKIKTLKRKSLFTFLKIQNKYKIKKKKKIAYFF